MLVYDRVSHQDSIRHRHSLHNVPPDLHPDLGDPKPVDLVRVNNTHHYRKQQLLLPSIICHQDLHANDCRH